MRSLGSITIPTWLLLAMLFSLGASTPNAIADEAVSRMLVHVSFPFDSLAATLNREVPTEFSGERDNPLDNPIKKDTLKWTVKRSEMSVANNSGKLEISSAFTGTVRVKGTVKLVVKVPFRAHADFGGTARALLGPKLTTDWHVTPNLNADVDLNKVVITLKDIGDIRVDRILREDLSKQLANLAGLLTTWIESDDSLHREALKLWERLCRAEHFEVDGSTQSLIFEPLSVVASNPVIENDRIVFGLGLDARIRIEPSEANQPSCTKALQEPKFVPLMEAGEFNLVVPLRVGWQVVSTELTRQIRGKYFGVLRANALRLSAHADGILVRLDYEIGGKTRTTFATARPVYDPTKGSLSLEKLKFTDQYGNARLGIDNIVDGLLSPAISMLRFDLKPELRKAHSAINSALKDLSAKLSQEGFNTVLEIYIMNLRSMSPETNGLNAVVTGNGKASVKITALFKHPLE